MDLPKVQLTQGRGTLHAQSTLNWCAQSVVQRGGPLCDSEDCEVFCMINGGRDSELGVDIYCEKGNMTEVKMNEELLMTPSLRSIMQSTLAVSGILAIRGSISVVLVT